MKMDTPVNVTDTRNNQSKTGTGEITDEEEMINRIAEDD